MKDMSVEELLEIVSRKLMFDFEYYDKAKAELLRRFEDSKCCGNCNLGYSFECIQWQRYKNEGGDYPIEGRYCANWQSDGLTREEREGK